MSTACSAGTFSRRHLNISFLVSSSTSIPFGALATKSISPTCLSSLRIRSPPRSPSRNAVVSLDLVSCAIDGGTLVPPIAVAFLMPCFRRIRTSALPSHTIIDSPLSTSGPAGLPLYDVMSADLTDSFSSSVSVDISGTSFISSLSSIFDLSMICFLFTALISSIDLHLSFASHGPTLSIVSIVAAISAVSVLSRLDGIVIFPLDFPLTVVTSTSILPILPVLWSSLKSSSLPKRPSLCPNNAPITSGFSTVPSASNSAVIRYFTDVCANFPIFITSVF